MKKDNDYELIKTKEKIDDVIYGVLPYYITPFMSLPYQLEINGICKRANLPIYYYNDGERKAAIIGEIDNQEDYNPIRVIRINTYEELKHNEIMGAILNIGIKRELVGNITTTNNEYLIEVMEHIIPFVKENFNYVSHHRITIEETTKKLPNQEREKRNIIVSSMRLDNVVSSVFNMSREQAKQAIINEDVAYNFETKLRIDQKVLPDSYLSCRKKGKAIIRQEIAKTRKENIVVEVEFY